MKQILVALIFTFSQMSFATCKEDVQVLQAGEKAQCDGVLLSPIASKKADEAIQDAKYYKNLSEKLTQRQEATNKEVEILDQRLQLYVNQSDKLATEIVRKDSDSNWQKVIWFSLGVIATGIAVSSASHLR